MQRIAGMIVKAGGVGFEATYNGQRDKVVDAIREEMERQKAAMCAEMDRMKAEYEKEIQSSATARISTAPTAAASAGRSWNASADRRQAP